MHGVVFRFYTHDERQGTLFATTQGRVHLAGRHKPPLQVNTRPTTDTHNLIGTKAVAQKLGIHSQQTLFATGPTASLECESMSMGSGRSGGRTSGIRLGVICWRGWGVIG